MKVLVRHEFDIPDGASRDEVDQLSGFLHDALDGLDAELPSIDIDFKSMKLGVELVAAEGEPMKVARDTRQIIRLAFEMAGAEITSEQTRVWVHRSLASKSGRVTQVPVPA